MRRGESRVPPSVALTEYAADGASVTMTDFDCTDLESFYCQTGTQLYRDVWSCSGRPGACVDAKPDKERGTT